MLTKTIINHYIATYPIFPLIATSFIDSHREYQCNSILVEQTPPGWNLLMVLLTGTAIASLWLPAQQLGQQEQQESQPEPPHDSLPGLSLK